jgi:cysteine desulfurase
MRSGTLNTPLIVGFGLACKIASIRLFSDQKHYQKLRDVFFEELIGLSYRLNGDPESHLLNTVNITFNDWKNPSPLFLELIPFSVSQSSACSTEGGQKRVLKTLSISEPGTLRISFGRPNTEEHVRALAHKITSVVSPII